MEGLSTADLQSIFSTVVAGLMKLQVFGNPKFLEIFPKKDIPYPFHPTNTPSALACPPIVKPSAKSKEAGGPVGYEFIGEEYFDAGGLESVVSSGAVHRGLRMMDLSMPESKTKPKPQSKVPVTSHLSTLLSSDSTPSIAKRTVGFRTSSILN
ncbi:hypothetical protein LguiA_027028 [Lonicera macranthoides]